MWEIAADAAEAGSCSRVREIAEQVDIFSINRTEALHLTQAHTPEEAVQALLRWQVPLIYLRLGSRGVCLLQNGRSVFVPSVPDLEVVDSTGGGNSSSGGALIGFCRGCSLEEIGAMGNVSSSFLGYYVAMRYLGRDIPAAAEIASLAAAKAVEVPGAAPSIPHMASLIPDLTQQRAGIALRKEESLC